LLVPSGATGSFGCFKYVQASFGKEEKFNVRSHYFGRVQTNTSKRNGALERRFQKVIVEPTTVAETIEILKNIKGKYEDHP